MLIITKNQFLKLCIFSFWILSISLSCNENTQEAKIMTVKGEILAKQMGKTLPHEHVLVDFIGARQKLILSG